LGLPGRAQHPLASLSLCPSVLLRPVPSFNLLVALLLLVASPPPIGPGAPQDFWLQWAMSPAGALGAGPRLLRFWSGHGERRH
jgi:hypothetical protein